MFIISAPGEFHSICEDELKMFIALSGWYILHVFVLLGWLNLILKEWLTISRGAEPHAQNANHENRKNITG